MKKIFATLTLVLTPLNIFAFGSTFDEPQEMEDFAPSPDQPFGFVKEMSTFNVNELADPGQEINVPGTMPAKYKPGECIFSVPSKCLSKLEGQFICPTQIKRGQELSETCQECLYKEVCEKIACKNDKCVKKCLKQGTSSKCTDECEQLEAECKKYLSTEDLGKIKNPEYVIDYVCSAGKKGCLKDCNTTHVDIEECLQDCDCYTDCQFCYNQTA